MLCCVVGCVGVLSVLFTAEQQKSPGPLQTAKEPEGGGSYFSAVHSLHPGPLFGALSQTGAVYGLYFQNRADTSELGVSCTGLVSWCFACWPKWEWILTLEATKLFTVTFVLDDNAHPKAYST